MEKLSKRDFRQLKKMVDSPFFNQRKDVIDLFQYLNEEIANAKKPKLDRQTIFEAIFPKERFDMQKLRYTMSFLHKLIQEYFIITEANHDPILSSLHLCRALRKRGIVSGFQKELKILQQKKKKQKLNNTLSHFQNYQIALEHFEFSTTFSREGDKHLGEIANELSWFYFADLLKLSCHKLVEKSVLKKDLDFTLTESILPIIEQQNFLDKIAIRIYYHIYRSLKDEDNEADFIQLKTLIEAHWDEFSKSEARELYTFGINYCIRKLNSGDRKYIREAFELYKAGFSHQLFYENGGLSSFQYKNVVRLGIGLGELEWVEDFMEEQSPFLFQSERKNTYNYNLAYFNFHKKDYDQALELLQQMEYKEVLLNLDARRMILCIYYERNEFEPLYSLLKSFTTYIRRHKNKIGYHSKNYLNLIKFITKMINSNLSDKTVKHQIRKEVEATNNVAEKTWLLSMLE